MVITDAFILFGQIALSALLSFAKKHKQVTASGQVTS